MIDLELDLFLEQLRNNELDFILKHLPFFLTFCRKTNKRLSEALKDTIHLIIVMLTKFLG